MEASEVTIKETVSANKKLQASDAKALVKGATKLIIAKGKKLDEYTGASMSSKEAIENMLGTTGNLRAPLAKVGKTLIVGFNEDVYEKTFG